jgi:hypothetical protein
VDVAGYTKTFAMSQGDVLGNDQTFQALFDAPLTDAKRQGICCGLSIIWLARRKLFHDETAEQRKSALYTGAGFIWGGRTQDAHNAAGTAGADIQAIAEQMWNDPLRPYVLRVARGAKVAYGTDPGALAGSAAGRVDGAGDYCLWNIGLSPPSGNCAHIVASYTSHGALGLGLAGKTFYFFDPNLGEYAIPSGDIEDFTKKLLEAYQTEFGGVRYVVTARVERG